MLPRQVVAMATMLVALAGTLVSPKVFSPQARTRPSERSATLWREPAATLTTLIASGGILAVDVSPEWPSVKP
jgi:hypothetical protein